jgi:ribose 5-phosphate isomerase B
MSYERADIEALVREVVTRTLGNHPAAGASVRRQRPLLDAEAVQQMPVGSVQMVAPNTLITPLARQAALERRIELSFSAAPTAEQPLPIPTNHAVPATANSVALGADHGGYALKEQLKQVLEKEYRVIDCGTHSAEAVDYPDFAYAVARLVADGRAWRGIIIDGAGIGSCMAANKVPGVRAAMCYDQATAVNSREHNNANVLTLGAGLIGPALARQIVTTWLTTDFGGGRHARRVEKIDAIGQRFTQKGGR